MPRKPKAEKQVRTFVVDGHDVRVSFFPPAGRERSWYVYWSGLPTRKTKKQKSLDAAVAAVQRMLLGDEAQASRNILSDDEFDEIQRQHYDRIQAKPVTVKGCFEAIQAFRVITGVSPISQTTAEDCARFQDEAVKLQKNWRAPYRDEERRQKRIKKGALGCLSRQTILKWSTALSAAFNRANANAGKKCIRTVVPPEKLLLKNPWDEVSWIEDKSDVKVRQFTPEELISIIDFFEQSFPLMKVAPLAAKVFFWSFARKKEVSQLKWDDLRKMNVEIHFDIVGKWRVRRWFRIPTRLYEELLANRVAGSLFVFAAYADQLRQHHASTPRSNRGTNIRTEFTPETFGDWFYERIVDWSETQGASAASVHAFRKTGLQQAVDGEVTNQRVASDAGVNVGVMTNHYTTEQERQLRAKSNRSFERIARSLRAEILLRYGYTPEAIDPLQLELADAVRNQNWGEVGRISQLLSRRDQAG